MAMLDGELLRTRVDSKEIASELLIYSSCIRDEHPQILKRYSKTPKLHVCMEEHHMNKVAWKIQSIARVKGLKKIIALTMDGSPHCVQLQYAADDVGKIFSGLEVVHEVIADRRLKKISDETVRRSRHLGALKV